MKILLTIIGLTMALLVSAAEKKERKSMEQIKGISTNAPAPNLPTNAPPKSEWKFAAKEWSVDSFYVARFSGDFDNAQQGFGFGVGYSLTPSVVVSVLTTSYLDDPQFLNEIAGRITYRVAVPFIPIKHLAAYGYGEGGGGLQTGDGFGEAGGGLEYRIYNNLDFKVESGVRLTTEWTPSIGILAGLGWHF